MSASHILVCLVQNDYKRILNCKWPERVTGTEKTESNTEGKKTSI